MKTSKKIFFFLILLIVNCTLTIENSPAQWIAQNSGTNQNLYDVEFINENTGWALGDVGIIIKTTNGGANWINVPNPSINAGGILWGIHPVDSNVVYVAGGHEVILKTTDGGASWIEIRNGPFGAGTGFIGVYFLNQDTGWFCGSQRVLRTTNGGQSFDSAYVPYLGMMDIYFKDFNTGLICQEGRVLKSTNGGLNWFDTNVPTGGQISFFRKLAVAEDQYAWVMGNYGNVFKTYDFGDTWSLIDTIDVGGFIPISFSSALTGWAGSTGNKIYKSTDGGYTWLREQTDPGGTPLSIRFINDLTGWIVGGSGRIYHTITGGQTMVNISNNWEAIVEEYELYQNFPNPFNPLTTITFSLPHSGRVQMNIYNALGQLVSTPVSEHKQPGTYSVTFDASDLPSGVYYYKLDIDHSGESGYYSQTRKMILLK